MTPSDWIALSLSGLTLVAVAIQWADSNKKNTEAVLAAAEARGRAEAQFESMSKSVAALHRRWDEIGQEIQHLREALISIGKLSPIGGRSRSRPPLPESED